MTKYFEQTAEGFAAIKKGMLLAYNSELSNIDAVFNHSTDIMSEGIFALYQMIKQYIFTEKIAEHLGELYTSEVDLTNDINKLDELDSLIFYATTDDRLLAKIFLTEKIALSDIYVFPQSWREADFESFANTGRIVHPVEIVHYLFRKKPMEVQVLTFDLVGDYLSAIFDEDDEIDSVLEIIIKLYKSDIIELSD